MDGRKVNALVQSGTFHNDLDREDGGFQGNKWSSADAALISKNSIALSAIYSKKHYLGQEQTSLFIDSQAVQFRLLKLFLITILHHTITLFSFN